MKTQFSRQRSDGLTRVDVLVLAVLFAIILLWVIGSGASSGAKAHAQRINCLSNLKGISFSFIIWAGDHNNQYPMSVSVTNGGAKELAATGNVAACFQAITNELSTPKVLICPADREHIRATNFTTDFNNSHISFFLNLDARKAYRQELMSGDDNFAINGATVKPGLLLLSTNTATAISWTAERHVHVGNLSFADGSVAEESNSGLQNSSRMSVEGTDVTTNRIAIP